MILKTLFTQKNKIIIVIIALTLLVSGVFFLVDYLGLIKAPSISTDKTVLLQEELDKQPLPTSVPYKLEVVAQGVYVPWSIVFTSPTRVLFTERNGNLRVIENDVLQKEPLKVFANVSKNAEEGLMGLAIDPDYSSNRFIYISYAYEQNNDLKVRVVRFKDNNDSLVDEKVILDNIPAAQYHAGCRIKFGPDKKLYVTTGDATDRNLAQDKNSLAGKLLRMNNDGTVPQDNPFPNSLIYSYGHRNSQGIDWTHNGILYSSEHGPSLFDGPAGGDEINLIEKGNNYGWPIVSHNNNKEGLIAPKLVFTPAVAPGSLLVYKSDYLPQFKNNILFGALRGEGIIHAQLSQDQKNIVAYEKLADINLGRIREIIEAPDGSIYFSTSNKDGRGNSRNNDDKIIRIVRQ